MTRPLPPALLRVLDVLRCPLCREPLTPAADALRCPAGHTFDIARQGYVSLLGGTRATSGDDAAMVRARERFLATGAYDPISDAVAGAVAELAGGDPSPATVLDVGCGTGRHLARVLETLPDAVGLGLDTSTRALRAAVRAHPRLAGATWDVFRDFPLVDGSCDVVMDVFAPRNAPEFRRVLRPGGRLVVVRPTGDHLAELRAEVTGMVDVDPGKERRLADTLAPYFEEVGTQQVHHRVALTHDRAVDLVAMTPSARHVDAALVEGDPDLPGEVTVSVLVGVYRPR